MNLSDVFYATLELRSLDQYFLHELAGLVCQIPCCSFPSDSSFHRWPLVLVSHPLCPSHLCLPEVPEEGPEERYVHNLKTHFTICLFSYIDL